MSKLEVGQRIRMVTDFCSAKEGMTGTIIEVKYDFGELGVRFDKAFVGGHTCGGKCEDGFGQWVKPFHIELIEATITKHKVGEVVRVKSTMNYGNYGGIYPSVQQMAKRGKEVKIKSVTKNGRYKVEGSIFTWTDEMFEEVVDKFVLSVVFDGGHKEYNYSTDDKTIKKGDKVVVPAGRENRHTTVTVTNVKPCDDLATYTEYKRIIRKCTADEVTTARVTVNKNITITENFGDTTVTVVVTGKLDKKHIEKVLSRIVD